MAWASAVSAPAVDHRGDTIMLSMTVADGLSKTASITLAQFLTIARGAPAPPHGRANL